MLGKQTETGNVDKTMRVHALEWVVKALLSCSGGSPQEFTQIQQKSCFRLHFKSFFPDPLETFIYFWEELVAV